MTQNNTNAPRRIDNRTITGFATTVHLGETIGFLTNDGRWVRGYVQGFDKVEMNINGDLTKVNGVIISHDSRETTIPVTEIATRALSFR